MVIFLQGQQTVRVPGFPRGRHQLPKGCSNLLFCKFFSENYLKINEFGPRGRIPGVPLDPPLKAFRAIVLLLSITLQIERLKDTKTIHRNFSKTQFKMDTLEQHRLHQATKSSQNWWISLKLRIIVAATCTPSPCLNSGICNLVQSVVQCTCVGNWGGILCDVGKCEKMILQCQMEGDFKPGIMVHFGLK